MYAVSLLRQMDTTVKEKPPLPMGNVRDNKKTVKAVHPAELIQRLYDLPEKSRVLTLTRKPQEGNSFQGQVCEVCITELINSVICMCYLSNPCFAHCHRTQLMVGSE